MKMLFLKKEAIGKDGFTLLKYLLVLWSLLLVLSLPQAVASQAKSNLRLQNAIDSLKTALIEETNPEQKADLMYKLAVRYINLDLRKSIEILDTAVVFSEKLESKMYYLRLMNALGVAKRRLGSYAASKEAFLRLHEESVKQDDKFHIFASSNNLGNLYLSKGEHMEAIVFFEEALKSVVYVDTLDLPVVLNNLGQCYKMQGNYDRALEYYLQSRTISEKYGNAIHKGNIYRELGRFYLDIGELEEAVAYLIRSNSQYELIDNLHGIGINYLYLSDVSLEQGHLEKAISYANNGVKIFQENKEIINYVEGLCKVGEIYNRLGSFHMGINKFKEANAALDTLKSTKLKMMIARGLSDSYMKINRIQNALLQALEYHRLASLNALIEEREESSLQLSLIYEKLNNSKKALEFYKTYSALKDSIFTKDKYKEIGRLEAVYEAESEAEQQRSKIALQASIIDKQFAINSGVIAILCLSIIFLAFFIRIYWQKQKSNVLLSQQNSEIKSQKEQIQLQSQQLTKSNQDLHSTIEHLKKLQTQMVQSEKLASLGMLTAGIAHEINNPLNFAHAGVKALRKRVVQLGPLLRECQENQDRINSIFSEMEELVESAERGTSRTSEIVTGLRSFSHSNENKIGPVKIHEYIDTALMMLSSKIRDEIQVEKEYTTLPAIEGNAGKLNQLFLNIISNAIQAIPEEGKIKIKTFSKDEEWITISIEDTGVGIDNETQSQIFEPFFTTKEVYTGTGLGLSISQNIVEQHQGTIACVSQKGKGTKFIINLPKRQTNDKYEGETSITAENA